MKNITPETGIASEGYTLGSFRFKTWLVILALLFGGVIFGLASQTIAHAAPTPQVGITKTGPATAQPGQLIDYTLVVTSTGAPLPIQSGQPVTPTLTVNDFYPAGLSYVSGPAECSLESPLGIQQQGLEPTGDFVSCEVDAPPQGETRSIVLTFRVSNSSEFFNVCVDNTATVRYNYPTLQQTNPTATAVATTCIIPRPQSAAPPADLIAQLLVTPDRTIIIDPATDISYTLTVKNLGAGRAERVQINFPYDPNLTVGFATFSDPRMWVSAVVTDVAQPYVTIELPEMDNNQTLSATLVLRPLATATSGASIFNRFTVGWDDESHSGNQAGSNGVRYTLSSSNLDLNGGKVQLFDPAQVTLANGQAQTITGDFFAPNETVTFWYTDQDGNSTPLGTGLADTAGHISVTITPVGLIAGDKYVVAGHGNRSDIYGSSVLTIGS